LQKKEEKTTIALDINVKQSPSNRVQSYDTGNY